MFIPIVELERIFSDAHLVDLDFSAWDKELRLFVLADHYRAWEGRCPLLFLRFTGVRKFEVEFHHLDLELKNVLGPEAHVQWLIDDPEIQREGRHYDLLLSSSLAAAPTLRLLCENVLVTEIDPAPIDRGFPGWNQPGSGLIRPGVLELLKQK